MNNEKLVEYFGHDRNVLIPDHIKIIGERAFAKASEMKSLVIPDSVTTIERESFSQISGFSGWSVSTSGIKLHGSNLISNSSQLESIVFGKSVQFIGESAFCSCSKLRIIDLPESLENIEDYAFAETGLKSVVIPKHTRHIGKASFFGCDEISVFDSLDADAVEASEWKYHEWNGSLNSDLSCALLQPKRNYTMCQGNTDWQSHHIIVRSAKTDQVKYKIWVDGNEINNDYRALMFSAWGRHASFKFAEYDTLFERIKDSASRAEMAFCRLEFPYKLSDERKETYSNFLERCLYIERSARKVLPIIIQGDHVERLMMLLDLGAIGPDQVPLIIDEAEKGNAKRVLAKLKEIWR